MEGDGFMVNDEIRAIAQMLRQTLRPTRMYLFGSFAKGTARADSDYDLYIVVPDDAGNPLELSRLAYDAIRGMKQRRADIIIKHESVFLERASHNTIERTVVQEGIPL